MIVSMIINDPLTDSLNHPAGYLTEAALKRLVKRNPREGEGIPKEVVPYFKSIVKSTHSHKGRVILASRLNYLFTIDPDWTTKNIIKFMDLKYKKDALDLWSSYSWSSVIGPNLFRAIKDGFLDVLKLNSSDYQASENLVTLFIMICLDASKEFTKNEIHDVVENFSAKELITVLIYLRSRIAESDGQNDVVWEGKVWPWLDNYWPQLQNLNTSDTSCAFLELLVECKDTFPNAVERVTSLDILKPIDTNHCRGLYRLQNSDHPTRFPHQTLQLLNKTMDDELQNWNRPELKRILTKIKDSSQNLVSDVTFKRLWKIAQRDLI